MKKLLRGVIYIIAFIWIIPLVWVLLTAFKDRLDSISLGIPHGFTFENFINVWQAAPFGKYFINTIIIVIGIFFIQVITSTLAGYSFARLDFFGKNILFIIVLVQLMIPNDVLIFPNYITIKNLSLIDTKLAVMLPYWGSAFGIFLLRQNFKTIPRDLEESAKMDGCHLLQILWHIYVPLAKPTYIAFGLVSISYHWNNYMWPMLVTDSTSNRPLTVGLSLFANTFETGAQWAEVSAATTMIILPLLILFMAFQDKFIDSFIHSGIK